MNKVSSSNDDYEMLDDYSEMFEKNWSKVVRGKYSDRYPKDRKPIVRITAEDGVRYVTMKWIEAQGTITPDRKLTVLLPSSISPGEYQVTLLIKEPTYLNFEEANISKDTEQYVTIQTIKTQAISTSDGNLTAQVSSDFEPGEYQVTLIIEEPANLPSVDTSALD